MEELVRQVDKDRSNRLSLYMACCLLGLPMPYKDGASEQRRGSDKNRLMMKRKQIAQVIFQGDEVGARRAEQ
eukprot:428812-Hanusia_phi.AAC.1